MAALKKCSECHYYSGNLDFGHDACLEHRACHTRRDYNPNVCVVCRDNRKVWKPLSPSLSEWRRELALHCRRLGGEDLWPFKAAFSSFFEVVLYTGSDSGSRLRNPLPQRGRGSRSTTPLPRAQSTARSLASCRSRSPIGGADHRDRRSGVSHSRSRRPTPPAGPSGAAPLLGASPYYYYSTPGGRGLLCPRKGHRP